MEELQNFLTDFREHVDILIDNALERNRNFGLTKLELEDFFENIKFPRDSIMQLISKQVIEEQLQERLDEFQDLGIDGEYFTNI